VAVLPDGVNVPQPEAGLRLQVTPALEVSLVTVAVSVTGELPAFMVVAAPDWVRETTTALAPPPVLPPLAPVPHAVDNIPRANTKANTVRRAARRFMGVPL